MTVKITYVGIFVWLVAGTAMGITPINIQQRAQLGTVNVISQQPQPTIEDTLQSEPERIPAPQNSPTTEPSKVIIRPASTLTTPKPFKNHRMPENTDNGCKCESLDTCPIELMDFSFSVSCGYGTVRCCRPIEPSTEAPVVVSEEIQLEVSTEKPASFSTEPATTEDSLFTKPVVVTPTTVKFVKKPMSCKCKPRKECDRFFQTEEEVEVFDRKDVLTCPAGMVRCCESGNMGNQKETTTPKTFKKIQATQILGNVGFKPVQLPFLTVPSTSNQRISEQEPQLTDQELQPLENKLSTPASTDTTTSPTTETPAEKPIKVKRPQIFFPQPVFVPYQQQQQQMNLQQLPQQPTFHPQANIHHQRPITPPVIEAGFQPIISNQEFSGQPIPVRPVQVFGLRPAPPHLAHAAPAQSIQPVSPQTKQNATTTTPRPTRRTLRPQFGLSVPTPPPSASPQPALHTQMRPPIGNLPFQPLQRPPPPPQRSSGFFSSLLNMFS